VKKVVGLDVHHSGVSTKGAESAKDARTRCETRHIKARQIFEANGCSGQRSTLNAVRGKTSEELAEMLDTGILESSEEFRWLELEA
jgi:hypothetical protein